MENQIENYNKERNKNTKLTIEEETEYQITNEMLKDATVVNSLLGSKFVLDNIKKDKEHITKYSTFIRSNFGSYLGKSKITKIYYDTEDMFFHSVGINICESSKKGDKFKKIVVRYDSKVERITYLKFLPDTYELKVKANTPIYKHFNFIESAILQLITNGLQTNVKKLLEETRPLIIVTKDRESYKFNLPSKLNLFFNFDKCVYTTPRNNDKYREDILETIAENKPEEFEEAYNQFVKDLILDLPTLVKTKDSDLFIGLDFLLDIRE
ncbi:MAG: hypothetical protein IJA61_02615 [Clostridia bacterium]|nr:hypothetical protein [Clostridia bacterium]